METLKTDQPGDKLLPKMVFLAMLAAGIDYAIRKFIPDWGEEKLWILLMISLPIVYFFLPLMIVVYRLRLIAPAIFNKAGKLIAVANIIYCLYIEFQIYGRGQGVGSSVYSIVSPLLLSGIPAAILTFLVFFRKPRNATSGTLMCLATVLWLVMPVGIDAFYLNGGYGGNVPPQIAVVSTLHAFLKAASTVGMFLAFITGPAAILIGVYRTVKSRGIHRLYSLSTGLSILVLSLQFLNWGGFITD